MSDLTGSTFGNYVIKGKIGEGGMGAVYIAEHKRFGRKVAIKTLHPHLARNQEMVSRFFTEARSANEIRNQHIIEILDFDELEDGTCYIVMEWLEGRSLAQLIASEGRLELERALHIADGICSALGAAHARKIIHRDLKPDNVLLEERNGDPDYVKVLDFGIAKLLEEDDAKKGFATRTGAIIGTPAYMSPEQCRGAHKDIDHRTDIYAVGAMVYQMVTGRRPFAGEGLGELLMAHLTQEPEPPSKHAEGIPPHVDRAILRALAKKREDRFLAMEDLAAALNGIEVPIGGSLGHTRTGRSGLHRLPGATASRTPSRPDAEPTEMGDPSLLSTGGGRASPSVGGGTAAAGGSVSAQSHAPRVAAQPAPQLSTFSSVASELLPMDERPRRRGNSTLVVVGAVAAIACVGGVFTLMGGKEPAHSPVDPTAAVANPAPAAAPAPAAPVPVPAPGAAPSAASPVAAAAVAPAAAPSVAPPPAAGAAPAAAAPIVPRTEPAAGRRGGSSTDAPAIPRELPKLRLPEGGEAPPPAAAAPAAPAAPAPAAPAPAAKIDRGPALEKALEARQDALAKCLDLKGGSLKKVNVDATVTVDASGSAQDVDVTVRSAEGEIPDELRACFERALKKGSYPKGSATDVSEAKWTLSAD